MAATLTADEIPEFFIDEYDSDDDLNAFAKKLALVTKQFQMLFGKRTFEKSYCRDTSISSTNESSVPLKTSTSGDPLKEKSEPLISPSNEPEIPTFSMEVIEASHSEPLLNSIKDKVSDEFVNSFFDKVDGSSASSHHKKQETISTKRIHASSSAYKSIFKAMNDGLTSSVISDESEDEIPRRLFSSDSEKHRIGNGILNTPVSKSHLVTKVPINPGSIDVFKSKNIIRTGTRSKEKG